MEHICHSYSYSNLSFMNHHLSTSISISIIIIVPTFIYFPLGLKIFQPTIKMLHFLFRFNVKCFRSRNLCLNCIYLLNTQCCGLLYQKPNICPKLNNLLCYKIMAYSIFTSCPNSISVCTMLSISCMTSSFYHQNII